MMVNREDFPIVFLGALGFLLLQLTIASYGIGSIIATFIGPVFISLILFYTAYVGLKLRRILFSPTYKRQAKGIALVSFASGIIFATGAMNGPIVLRNAAFATIQGIAAYAWLLIIFYWLDASIQAGRRSDPLARDTFNWSRVRMILWPAIIVTVFTASAIGIYFYITGNVAAIFGPVPPSINPLYFGVMAIINNAPQVITFGTGLVFLPVLARRAKDIVLRPHLMWFGIFALMFISSTLVVVFTALFLPPNTISCPPGFVTQAGICARAALSPYVLTIENISLSVGYLAFLIGAYGLSRSIRSLVPHTEIEVSEGGEFVRNK
jgi:hypothetical protein